MQRTTGAACGGYALQILVYIREKRWPSIANKNANQDRPERPLSHIQLQLLGLSCRHELSRPDVQKNLPF